MDESDIPFPGRAKSLLTELQQMYSPATLDQRGENAWAVAVKFRALLEKQIPDEEERKRLLSAWFKSVRDNDYRKFKRALNRYRRSLDGITEPEEIESSDADSPEVDSSEDGEVLG